MAKKKKNKIPKKIAGVKVPKDLRKKAEAALDLAGNPVVRDLAGAALVAAAGAWAKRKAGRDNGEDHPDEPGDAAGKPEGRTGEAGAAIRKAATDIALSMLDAVEASLKGKAAPPPDSAGTVPDKKPVT